MKLNFVFLLLLTTAGAAMAQGPICSEQKIRELVQKESYHTTDAFFWSGAYDRPLIGSAEIEKGNKEREAAAPRKNEDPAAQHPQKIEVSKSSDMAYEYGTGSLSFDSIKEKKHLAFELAYLRVWKAVDGECRATAIMMHPIESTIKETPIQTK